MDNLGDTILVTGATGFIGSRLALELARRGERVRVLIRRDEFPMPPNLDPELSRYELDVTKGDITDVSSLQRAMQGCRQVYHLAGYASNWARDPKTYYDVNVQGLRNILDTAEANGIKKVVWTSSVVTFQPTKPGEIADESTPRSIPFFTEYERSKAQGEELVQQYADRVPVVIVNPSRVYGPGHLTESNSLVKIIDMYDRGRAPFMLGGGRPVGNYVFIDDVVQGLILAMQRGRPGRRYMIGGPNASFREFFDTVDRVTGKRHFRIPIRRPAALAIAYFYQMRANWFGIHPEITPPWIRHFLAHWAYSTRRAEDELGYRQITLEEGISRTYQWLAKVRESKRS